MRPQVFPLDEGTDLRECASRSEFDSGSKHKDLLKEAALLRRQAETIRALLRERAATPLE